MSQSRTIMYLVLTAIGVAIALRLDSGMLLVVGVGVILGRWLFDLLDELADGFARSQIFKDLTAFFGYDDEEEDKKK